jgi:fructokinase
VTPEPTPFLVVGEALVDIVVPSSGSPTTAPGGSPMNVAVGLSRLDVPTVLVTEIGDDEHGRLIAGHVEASGVRLAAGSVRPGGATSTATARIGADGAADYDFELTWGLAPRRLPDIRGLHVGSLGSVLEPGRAAVLDLLEQASGLDVLLSYDPNIRPAFLPEWAQVAEMAARVDVLKLSDEDLGLLRPETSAHTVAREVLDAGRTSLVVVTRGSEGAIAFTEDTTVEVVAPPTDLVDTVGAGDSFMAALVAVLLEWGGAGDLTADRLRVLLDAAGVAAAVTCGRRGANPPTRRELPPGWPAG